MFLLSPHFNKNKMSIIRCGFHGFKDLSNYQCFEISFNTHDSMVRSPFFIISRNAVLTLKIPLH
jgi:hypothetical protein